MAVLSTSAKQKRKDAAAFEKDRRDLDANPSLAYLAEKRLTEAAKQQAKDVYPCPPTAEEKDRTWVKRQRK